MSILSIRRKILCDLNPDDIPITDPADSNISDISFVKNRKDLSNQKVLAVICLSFTLFIVAEIIGALVLIYSLFINE